MNIISGLIILSFSITPAGFFGTTTNGQTFSMVTLSDRVDVFRLDGKPLWYVCDGYIVDELKDLSICLSK